MIIMRVAVLFLVSNLCSAQEGVFTQVNTSTHVTMALEGDGRTDQDECRKISKIDSYPDYEELFSACGGVSGIESFVSREKGCFNCYLALAVHYSKIFNYADKIRENATKAMALRPTDVRPYEIRAKADTSVEGEGLMDHLDEAMSDYLKLVELEPGVASRKEDACRAAGEFPDGFNKNLLPKLVDICSKAQAGNPTDSEGYLNRGFLLIKRGKYAEALTDFDTVLRTDANNKKAFLGKGLSYESLKNWNKAAFYYSKHIDLGGDSYLNRGECYLRLGLCQKAKSDFVTASVGSGYNPVIAKQYMVAYYWRCEKNLAKTLESAEKLLKMGWECEGSCYRLDYIREFVDGLEEKPEYKALIAKYQNNAQPVRGDLEAD